MSSERWLLLALFLVALTPRLATAQPATGQPAEREPSMQEKETARALLDKGRAAEAKGDLPGAIASYRGAHAIMGVPTTGIYLALALSKSGKLIEAREVALQASRAPKLPAERPERTRARDDAARLLNDLGPRIPSIAVSPRPGDAPNLRVSVDGTELAKTVVGLPWAVDPGEHMVKVEADGYHPQTVNVRSIEGKSEAVTIDLAPLAGPVPSFVPPPPRPPKRDKGMRPAFIVAITGFSVGGVGLAVGGVMGGLSMGKTNDIKDQCSGTRCPASLQADADEAQTFATVSNVSLAVGGAFAVGGAIALGIGLAQGPKRSSGVGVFVGPTGIGLGGEF